MQALIVTLKHALQQEYGLHPALEHADENCWQVVAVVHEARRVKEPKILSTLQEQYLLDRYSFTPALWNSKKIALLQKLASKYK